MNATNLIVPGIALAVWLTAPAAWGDPPEAAHETAHEAAKADSAPAPARATGSSAATATSASLPAAGARTPVSAPAAESAAPTSASTTAVVAGARDAATQPPDPLLASVIDDGELANARGGADTHINQNTSTGTVTNNVASQLTTGSNTIGDGSFSNTSGIPIVIQNSGNNVLIQNSTILNLQMQSPK